MDQQPLSHVCSEPETSAPQPAGNPSSTVRLRIDLAYDGAPFRGYARQPDQTTVQGTIEASLQKLRACGEGVAVDTVCAGRTDAGVHAESQVIHVDVVRTWPRLANIEGIRGALDGMVGPAITITSVRQVPDTFNARFGAIERRYRFRLFDGPVMLPLLRHDTWHVPERLNTDAMEQAAQSLIGEHDYSSFCRTRMVRTPTGERVEGTNVRRIDRITVRRDNPQRDNSQGDSTEPRSGTATTKPTETAGGLILVHVTGAAFCHQMIRSITGTLVEVGRSRKPISWVSDVLAAQDRAVAGPVAPPHGLSLIGVDYDPAIPSSPATGE